MEAELKKRKINYKKQEPLCNVALVDFLLSKHKIVIQCDGCYWHGCPIHFPNQVKRREKDKRQDKVLKENGYIVYRFWGHEINEDVEKCVSKVLKRIVKLNKIPKSEHWCKNYEKIQTNNKKYI